MLQPSHLKDELCVGTRQGSVALLVRLATCMQLILQLMNLCRLNDHRYAGAGRGLESRAIAGKTGTTRKRVLRGTLAWLLLLTLHPNPLPR